MSAQTERKINLSVLKEFIPNASGRYNLGAQVDEFELPDLNQIQIDSFQGFLQEAIPAEKRKNIGLQFLFNHTFPFKSNDGKVRLEFDHYTVGEPRYSLEEALEKDRSLVVPVKATIRLILEETARSRSRKSSSATFLT